jgi:putative hydrolase of the HAD superfamily
VAVRGLSDFTGRRVVLLDALGTLVELEPPAPRLRVQLRERLGLSVSEADAQRAIEAEMHYYRAHLDEGADEPSLAGLRRRCAAVLWRELGNDLSDRSPKMDVLVEALMSSLSFRAFDDATDALAELKQLGLVLVVVSNWDVSLPGVLERVGLAGLVDGVITSAGAGARKPDPAVFDRALELTQVTAAEAVHVGDSLREDVDGARAAGIEPVLLVRSGSIDCSDTMQIQSLRELPPLWGTMRGMDEGLPIAYEVLESGVPVYSSDEFAVGTVDHVVAAESLDIFHGLVIRTDAGRKFVAADDVASLHERGVDLRISAAAVGELREPHGAAPTRRLNEPGIKPSRWKELTDMLTGARRHGRDWRDDG